jgi:hypothetical protein
MNPDEEIARIKKHYEDGRPLEALSTWEHEVLFLILASRRRGLTASEYDQFVDLTESHTESLLTWNDRWINSIADTFFECPHASREDQLAAALMSYIRLIEKIHHPSRRGKGKGFRISAKHSADAHLNWLDRASGVLDGFWKLAIEQRLSLYCRIPKTLWGRFNRLSDREIGSDVESLMKKNVK